jgi:sortase A
MPVRARWEAPGQRSAGERRGPAIPAMKRLIRDISTVLILSGLMLVLDAGVTLVWQEPVTAVVALIRQTQINTRLLSEQTAPLTPVDHAALKPLRIPIERIGYLARREERQVATGDAIGRIAIPKIGISFDVVQGTDELSLEKGPGHYPATAFPGLGQTVAIAGHRTTYLAPFRHIDALRSGDRIVLTMPYGMFTYVVQYHKIVLPTALWVTRNVGYDRLVLSACNPLYSAAQRIIVFARLDAVTPLGEARQG